MSSINKIGLMARVLGALIFAFFMLFIVGEGILGGPKNNFYGVNAHELLLIILLVAAVLGLAIGFWRDIIGGVVTTVCSLAWFTFELYGGTNVKKLDLDYWPFYLLLIAGVLFLVSGIKYGGRVLKSSNYAHPDC